VPGAGRRPSRQWTQPQGGRGVGSQLGGSAGAAAGLRRRAGSVDGGSPLRPFVAPELLARDGDRLTYRTQKQASSSRSSAFACCLVAEIGPSLMGCEVLKKILGQIPG
jgi:hypothetical protein